MLDFKKAIKIISLRIGLRLRFIKKMPLNKDIVGKLKRTEKG